MNKKYTTLGFVSSTSFSQSEYCGSSAHGVPNEYRPCITFTGRVFGGVTVEDIPRLTRAIEDLLEARFIVRAAVEGEAEKS